MYCDVHICCNRNFNGDTMKVLKIDQSLLVDGYLSDRDDFNSFCNSAIDDLKSFGSFEITLDSILEYMGWMPSYVIANWDDLVVQHDITEREIEEEGLQEGRWFDFEIEYV
jgi:hypothetical protein